MRRGLIGVALLAVLLAPASARAGHARTPECPTELCARISPDGSHVVFPFAEELTPGANRPQIYEWSAGGLRALVPFPPAAPRTWQTGLFGASADLQHVFVETGLALTPQDVDGGGQDVYDISAGVPTLLSTGPLDTQVDPGFGPMSLGMAFQGSSVDGRRVFLDSPVPLVAEDTDKCPDLYERSGGQTKLISTGPTATPSYPEHLCDLADYGGISADDSHVFFATGDRLIAEDEGGDDIYQRVGDALTVLTTYPEDTGSGCSDRPEFSDASADGRTVLFATNIPISPEDTDSTYDVYKREPDGSFTLVSRGTDGGTGSCGFGGDRPIALSADGRTAIFETTARLSPADTDSSNDVYAADGNGAVSLLSTGPTDPNLDERSKVFPDWVVAVSDDALHVAFETRQALVAADKDQATDVYVRVGGKTELASTGPLAGDSDSEARLLGISGDGTTVAFETNERLTARDLDGRKDVYLHRVGLSSAKPRPLYRRTVLISAETIAPRMRIAPRGRLLPSGEVAIRLGCPKVETSGPCHGAVKLADSRHAKPAGAAPFRIAAGRQKLVDALLRRSLHGNSLFARVRGADRLGNVAVTVRRVRLRHG